MIFSNILRLCAVKYISALELLQTERSNGQTDETVIDKFKCHMTLPLVPLAES